MIINTNQITNVLQPTGGKITLATGTAANSPLSMTGGDAQLYAYTPSSLATVMGYDPAGGGSLGTNGAGVFDIPSNSAWYVTGQIAACQNDFTDGSGTANNPVALFIEFFVARGNLANTTTLIGTPIITKKFGANNINIVAGSVAVAANPAGHITITVTGLFGVPYYWSCSLRFVRTGT